MQGTHDIKGWHASFQDLAHLKKLHPTLNGISLHQFHLRRSPLAKSPSSSSLYPASGCTAGRQFSCQGFWNSQARNPVVSWPTISILPTKDVVFYFEESTGLALMLIVDAYSEHAGQYCCKAANSAGEATCAATLTVTPKGKGSPARFRDFALLHPCFSPCY